MGEKSDQILEHIESQRDQLGRNLEALETKVKRTTDWRAHFDDNPWLMLGAAVGGGLILGAMVGGRSSSSSSSSSYPGSRYTSGVSSAGSSGALGFASPATAQARQHASETIDKIKAALIAFGTAKAKEFLAQSVPGLEQHLMGDDSPGPSSASSPSGNTAQPQANNNPVPTGSPV